MVGTLSGLMLSVLLASLDQTIVGTAEPRIIASLSGFNRYPWVSTAYLLCSTISVPIFAKLSDIYGRKWFLLGGSGGFVLASTLCGAAGKINFLGLDGMNQLILFRAIQGIGGGMMMGLAFTIIGDVFSPAERGKYQGVFSGAWGLSSIFGPTLGGWLTDQISWRATFYVNLPVGVVAIIALYFYFPYWRPEGVKRHIDWAGVVTLIFCIVPLLLALTWVTDYGWFSLRVELLLAMAVAMLGAFLYAETKALEPLIPLSLFRDPVISMCSIGIFVLGIGMFGVIIYLPLFMQGVLGVSATRSGSLLRYRTLRRASTWERPPLRQHSFGPSAARWAWRSTAACCSRIITMFLTEHCPPARRRKRSVHFRIPCYCRKCAPNWKPSSAGMKTDRIYCRRCTGMCGLLCLAEYS